MRLRGYEQPHTCTFTPMAHQLPYRPDYIHPLSYPHCHPHCHPYHHPHCHPHCHPPPESSGPLGGYVPTMLGRRRRLPDASSSNAKSSGHAMRAAINTPIQGSAADVATACMVKIWRHPRLREMGWKLLLQVSWGGQGVGGWVDVWSLHHA